MQGVYHPPKFCGTAPRHEQSYRIYNLALSRNPDFNLRRECAQALATIGPDRREVRVRFEEMTRDADDLVKDLAQRGLGTFAKYGRGSENKKAI
jgi:hypothetical protein